MGVENIITFDAHDPRVQNAIPLKGFETVQPIYQFIKYLLKNETELQIDSDHMMVISPDEGGMSRAVYFCQRAGTGHGYVLQTPRLHQDRQRPQPDRCP